MSTNQPKKASARAEMQRLSQKRNAAIDKEIQREAERDKLAYEMVQKDPDLVWSDAQKQAEAQLSRPSVIPAEKPTPAVKEAK